jgi:hypothetical protein
MNKHNDRSEAAFLRADVAPAAFRLATAATVSSAAASTAVATTTAVAAASTASVTTTTAAATGVAATATTAAGTTAAAERTSAAGAASTRRAILGGIHAKRAATKVMSIELFDRLRRILIGFELDERKPAGSTRLAIGRKKHVSYRSDLRKQRFDLVARRVEVEIPYENLGSHQHLLFCGSCLPSMASGFPRAEVYRVARNVRGKNERQRSEIRHGFRDEDPRSGVSAVVTRPDL